VLISIEMSYAQMGGRELKLRGTEVFEREKAKEGNEKNR
jgi:hypothetical protein